MPYSPAFTLSSFDQLGANARCKLVLELVRALVEVDTHYLANTPGVPLLYESGVIYRPQGYRGGVYTGIDEWWDIPECLAMGEGSCEDLASWRVAELRVRGGVKGARPFVHSREVRPGDWLYHIVVRLPNGVEEDPSALLGMRGGP